MISLLITSFNKRKRDEYINTIIQQEEIDAFDVTRIVPETSFGIELVRDVQKKAFLKPLKSKKKIIVLEEAHITTIEAQNALLKLLEEPPQDTVMILSADNSNTFLPTILSRCVSINLNEPTNIPPEESVTKAVEEFFQIAQENIGNKLFIAQEKAKTKEELLTWIQMLLYGLRTKLLENPHQAMYLEYLEKLQNVYQTISTTNINPRMTLEHFFLSLTSK